MLLLLLLRDCDFLILGQYTFFHYLRLSLPCKCLHRSENTCSNLCGKAFWTTLKVTLLRFRNENATAVTTTRAGLKTRITNGRAKN